MDLTTDIASRVSAELSQILEASVNAPVADEAPTLGTVRNIVVGMMDSERINDYRQHYNQGQTLLEEIDGLTEEFGSDALAIDFVTVKAGEDLSLVITAMMDTGSSNPPTLGTVREAMRNGLVARLIGEGAIDPDEDDTLLDDIETLISHYGQDAAAENFLHYE